MQTSNTLTHKPCLYQKPHKLKRGFTLLELMITIGIAGILAVMALPPLIGWVQNKKDQQNAQQILNVLKAARQTAMATKVSETLTFTPSNYNNKQRTPLTIGQQPNIRTHTFSSPIDFINITQRNGGNINQIRFNGFGLVQAPNAAGAWQNNGVRILLTDYGITFSATGVADICIRNATLATSSMPVCAASF